MRASSCALQQALTAEAATIVKQAVVLAKRRGHAQVTPLHVANTMLSASSGLFRAACLESHSHPLQCKALELCFNVALNRLPASSSSNPMLLSSPHSAQHPSISNALVAAFKRAQAHQRRGSIENQQQQQQTLLAVKIELEQLVISILDDPSVSRVMREAGFSSTQVKSNVEKTVSLELCSNRPKNKENTLLTLTPSQSPQMSSSNQNEDVRIVIENLLKKRKSVVLVGENISSLESTVKNLMDMVDTTSIVNIPDALPDALREVKFVTIPPLYFFCNLRREEVEQKIGELTCLVKGLLGKGVVLYLGDFKWISDYRVSLEEERRYYCSVEHMIMEIGRLVWGIGEIERFWLMGIATFQTYMRCRNGYHSLESVWGLHPVTIPANSLGFSLVSDQSDEQIVARHERVENPSSNQLLLTNGEMKLSCCADCSAKFEAEAQNLKTSFCNSTHGPTLSSLPSWLKNESKRLNNKNQGCDDAIKELCNKWNSFCSSSYHKQPLSLKETLNLSSTTSCFSFDQQGPNSTRTHFPLPDPPNGNSINAFSSHNSASSSDDITEMEYTQKFKEFNAENLNILCNALEKKVPWQREIIPEIAGTILQCRSGMLRRKNKLRGNNINSDDVKQETWLLFIGPDDRAHAKEKICKELAKVVFGSYSNFVSIGLNGLNSSDDCKSHMERFAKAVSTNPHRVFLLEDFEKADYCSRMGIKRGIERGRIRINESTGEEFGFCDGIIVLSCERFGLSTSSRACSPSSKGKTENYGTGEEETGGHCVALDLNISFDGDDVDQDQAVDDLGIFENVDRRVIFKFQEDL